MLPEVAGFSPYYASWALAAATFVLWGSTSLARRGIPSNRATILSGILAGSVLAGAKAAFLVEQALWPANVVWQSPNIFSGFRLPGGLLLAAVFLPSLARVCGVPPHLAVRGLFGPAWMAVAVVHVGCLLNGCCFGVPTSLPWAVELGPTTFTFALHRKLGWIFSDAAASAPVHPLPAYFAVLAATSALVGLVTGKGARLTSPFWVSVGCYGSLSFLCEALRPQWLPANLLADAAMLSVALARYGSRGSEKASHSEPLLHSS